MPQADELKALADLLNGAERITLFCGRGCAGAHAPLMQLAEALKSPIVHALGGKEHVEYDNPYDVGMTGFIGFSSGYAAMHACDALVMLGTDFPYKQFFPTDAKIAQIDIRPENLGRRCKIDLGLVGDVKLTIEALLPLLKAKTQRKHLDDAIAHYKKAREGLDSLAKGTPGSKPIHPQYLAKVISDHASDDAVFTADVGTPTVWAARYLDMNGRRRLIGSFVHGSMANAMPQAIGAQAAQPGRQVISLSGDGGFTMLMGDLITLTQMKLPVKVVIFNNGVLGFVALEMKAAGFVDTNVDLENPGLRGDGARDGHLRQARRGSRRASGRDEGDAGPQRTGAARRRHRQAGAVDAADHHARADQGLQPLGAARGDERPRRRGASISPRPICYRASPALTDGTGSRSWRRWKRCQCSTMPISSAGTKPSAIRKCGSCVGEMNAMPMSEISQSAANITAKSVRGQRR